MNPGLNLSKIEKITKKNQNSDTITKSFFPPIFVYFVHPLFYFGIRNYLNWVGSAWHFSSLWLSSKIWFLFLAVWKSLFFFSISLATKLHHQYHHNQRFLTRTNNAVYNLYLSAILYVYPFDFINSLSHVLQKIVAKIVLKSALGNHFSQYLLVKLSCQK